MSCQTTFSSLVLVLRRSDQILPGCSPPDKPELADGKLQSRIPIVSFEHKQVERSRYLLVEEANLEFLGK